MTGTATGVKGALLQEAGRPGRRSVRAPWRDPAPLARPSSLFCCFSNPPPEPRGPPGLGEEEEGEEGEARSLPVLPGQGGGRKLSCKFTIRSVTSL